MDEVLSVGREDWVGLWIVAGIVQDLGAQTEDAIRAESLKVIGQLLARGSVSLGLPNLDGSFSSWDLPAEQALSRLDFEWRQLGRTPNIGEIAWLDIEA